MRLVRRLDFYSLDFIFINVLSSRSVSFEICQLTRRDYCYAAFYWPIGNDKILLLHDVGNSLFRRVGDAFNVNMMKIV